MGAPDLNRPLTAQLVMTPELAGDLAREAGTLALVQTYVIDSPETAQTVNGELRDVKRRLKVVDEWDDRFSAPIRQLIETKNAFFQPARQALVAAEAHLKNLLTDWQKKEADRAAAAQRAAEEAMRKARQEAEQRAAAERARAAEQEREARARAAAAEEEKRKAAAEAERLRREGDATAAAEAEARARAAAAEEAKQQEKAVAAIENGEAKASAAQLTAAAAAAPAPVAAPVTLAGFGSRDNWIAEYAPGMDEDKVKELIVTAIAGFEALPTTRRELLAAIKLDLPAIGKTAKALKANFNVPGMKAVNKPVATSRG